jgi:hypothetical protein
MRIVPNNKCGKDLPRPRPCGATTPWRPYLAIGGCGCPRGPHPPMEWSPCLPMGEVASRTMMPGGKFRKDVYTNGICRFIPKGRLPSDCVPDNGPLRFGCAPGGLSEGMDCPNYIFNCGMDFF